MVHTTDEALADIKVTSAFLEEILSIDSDKALTLLIKAIDVIDALTEKQHSNYTASAIKRLLLCGNDEYKRLAMSPEDIGADLRHLSWASRNLLEVMAWTVFCLEKAENAKAFYQDAYKSEVDHYQSGIETHLAYLAPDKRNKGMIKRYASHIKQKRQEAGDLGFNIKEQKLVLTDIMKNFGILKMLYDAFYATTSRHLHIGPSSVLANEDKVIMKRYANQVRLLGCIYFFSTMTSITEYLIQNIESINDEYVRKDYVSIIESLACILDKYEAVRCAMKIHDEEITKI